MITKNPRLCTVYVDGLVQHTGRHCSSRALTCDACQTRSHLGSQPCEARSCYRLFKCSRIVHDKRVTVSLTLIMGMGKTTRSPYHCGKSRWLFYPISNHSPVEVGTMVVPKRDLCKPAGLSWTADIRSSHVPPVEDHMEATSSSARLGGCGKQENEWSIPETTYLRQAAAYR